MDLRTATIRTLAARAILLIAAGLLAGGAQAGAAAQEPSHAMAMHGAPAYAEGFDHFSYANPDAPEGGVLSRAVPGSFDSLNPFIVAGRAAVGVRYYHFPSLMARSWDEPFSLYGYVAERVDLPPHRRWVTFHLHPEARFHDGTPITVDDVIFTMETLREVGLPSFRRNYGRIAGVERVGERGVRFRLTEEADRETPMILGLMPVLSRAYHRAHPLDRAGLDIPLGGGPYRIAEVEPGRRIVYERVEDWWAADLPAFRGQYNFDRLRFDYYRDDDVALEAFRAGAYVFRRESEAERWATDYDFPAVDAGEVTLLTLGHGRPSGLRGFVFNTRRAPFDDRRVRAALAHAFDFEWVNARLLQGQYERISGMFTNSPLAPRGLPGPAELELLEPFRATLPDEVFGPAFRPPSTDGPGGLRRNLRTARRLLAEAGWRVREGVLVHGDTGVPLAFEIVLRQASDERIALAYADTLARLGVRASVRTVDSAQYTERMHTYDFDVTINFWNVTLSPGAEQDYYWGSRSAGIEGTRNLPGVRLPAVDGLIGALEDALTYEDLTAAARALDRVLMWGYYVVPLHYLDRDLVAHWGDLRRVEGADPLYGTVVEAWWQAP
jgi:microcin C transport system substrate-binding protein